jgi:hypothetical protein
MAIQADIDNALNKISNEYTGKRIGMPNGTCVGECTAPVTWFLYVLNNPWNLPMAHSRADGWGVNFPTELQPYFTHEQFQPGKAYPRGTILMWNSPHIAVVNHSDGSNVVSVFEQNADPDGAPCQMANRVINNSFHTCTYAMTPIIQAAAPQHPFTVTPLNPTEQLITVRACCSYNLDYPDVLQPYTGYPSNMRLEAVATVFHNNGKKYFMTDATGIEGFYEGDVTYYVEPAPLPPPPPPVQSPQGALPVPVATTEIYLETTLLTFPSATDALNHTKAKGTFGVGKYTVYATSNNGMLYINKNKGDVKWWINPADNTPEEVKQNVPVSTPEIKPVTVSTPVIPDAAPVSNPNQWKSTQSAFYLNRDPEVFTSRNLTPIQIFDLEGKHEPISLPAQKNDVRIVATFEVNGVLYGRPEACFNPKSQFYGSWYGVPMSALDYDSVTTAAERLALGTGRFKDKMLYEVSRGIKFLDGIKTKRSKK